MTFRQVRHAYPTATACGVVDTTNGDTRLSPQDTYVLTPRDAVVLLAPNQDSAHVNFSTVGASAARIAENTDLPSQGVKPADRGPASVAVLAPGGGSASQLVASVCEFAPRGSLVTLVTPDLIPSTSSAPHGAPMVEGVGAERGHRLRVVLGDPLDAATLRTAAVVGCDAVVMAFPCGWGAADEDAAVVATALTLQGLLTEHAAVQAPANGDGAHAGSSRANHLLRPPHMAPLNFVCCVRSERTRRVLRLLADAGDRPVLTMDAVLADDLVCGMLTQVCVCSPCAQTVGGRRHL